MTNIKKQTIVFPMFSYDFLMFPYDFPSASHGHYPKSKTLLVGQPERVFGQGGSHRILDSTRVPLLRWAPTIEPTPPKMLFYFGQGRLFLGILSPNMPGNN